MYLGISSFGKTLHATAGLCCFPRNFVHNSVWLVIATSLLALVQPARAWAADRVALVISVETYTSLTKSAVPVGTGQKIGDGLVKHGFDVNVVKDANNAAARAALRDFAQKASGASSAILVLTGHGVSAAGGHTYLLPSNADIKRDSDLLSQGISIPSVAALVGRAKTGAVLFAMTVADISSAMQGISARPGYPGTPPANVVVGISTSEKVPVSRVDKVSQQAALDLAETVAETPLLMSTLTGTIAAGGVGRVFGSVPDVDLSKGPQIAAAAPAPGASPSAADAAQRREAERKARQAEEQLRQAEAKARDAEDRAAEAKRAQQASNEGAPTTENVESLQIVEALFGRSKRLQIQAALRERKLYIGPVDAIFGSLTRQAIKDYQKSIGAEASGYLTPQQMQSLTKG